MFGQHHRTARRYNVILGLMSLFLIFNTQKRKCDQINLPAVSVRASQVNGSHRSTIAIGAPNLNSTVWLECIVRKMNWLKVRERFLDFSPASSQIQLSPLSEPPRNDRAILYVNRFRAWVTVVVLVPAPSPPPSLGYTIAGAY